MIWIIIAFVSTVFTVSGASSVEYCAEETYSATCGPGQVILMTNATVGRMFMGRCVNIDRGHIGCHGDALLQMDARCSGRDSCEVAVVEVSKKQSTCPKDLSSFMVAQHKCLQVVTCKKTECEQSDFLRPSATSGYLSAMMASQSECGTVKCPWMIEVLPGQRIKFTLYDFSLVATKDASCLQFGTIYDGDNERKDISNCNNQEWSRRVHVYTSLTNSVRVQLNQVTAQQHSFMVKYEAFGCADFDAPQYAEVERKGETVTVRCQHSKSTWHLTCNGSRWVGGAESCPDSQVNAAGSTDDDPANSSLGMLLVIGVGIALGVAVGVVLLCIVAAYMKKKQKRDVHKASSLLHGNPQYRDYLSKTGTMFGLYPTGQINNEMDRDHTLIYRPIHAYTSTLHPHHHPHLHRQLPLVHEMVSHHRQPSHLDYPPPEDGWDSSVYNQSIGTSAHGGCHGNVTCGGGPGSCSDSDTVASSHHYHPNHHSNNPQQQAPKEHIYELPSFPDRNRAHSADSGLAYSLSPYNDQASHRTT